MKSLKYSETFSFSCAMVSRLTIDAEQISVMSFNKVYSSQWLSEKLILSPTTNGKCERVNNILLHLDSELWNHGDLFYGWACQLLPCNYMGNFEWHCLLLQDWLL